MICRLCLNALDEQSAVVLFGGSAGSSSAAAGASASAEHPPEDEEDGAKRELPESYLVQLISIHLYLCLSRDDAISTCICTECCSQLESFHNFWKLVELKQTTLCSQFLAIDCDVNWSEEGTELLEEPLVAPVELEPEPKVVTPTTANKFPCMFCEKSFKMRRYLEEHIATHTGDRPIACPYCEMAFRCRSNMYTHVKGKHTSQWLKAREERDAAKSGQSHAATEVAPLPLSVIHSEPGEVAINLSLAKTPTNRSSRRKTHSPKKVQPTKGSDASDAEEEESPQKRLKENELMLANYNAVAAAVAALSASNPPPPVGQPTDSLQQRLQQDQLFAGTSSATTMTTLFSHPPAETSALIPVAPVSPAICLNCGELPGQNHRCLSKPKYACDVCGKCFKMKRYLEEHFATHTGVKLHTCAFCPTEFRSKSNMYHHTKRKHKAEWERSRATRSAAKASSQSSQAGVQDVAQPGAL
ncbi:gastrula zinc finger protein XlCGF26.1 [Drosophila takahashii]|uniref:gastrula zinc finger protein XlCGF26.1 n=1 Tax=Drosophila takahashii TaxID=29030 RepID=UPI001CF88BB9|nr:zinc finger and BTB domain-containing protein 41 [Drosophila takahashii]